MQKLYRFGASTYVSTFEEQQEQLKRLPTGTSIFTSLHIQEELNEGYKADAYEMMAFLKKYHFHVIADISPRTLSFFKVRDIVGFAREMGIGCLRVDYGFTVDETAAIAASFPVALNASTIDIENALQIKKAASKEVCAIHNFYPRPETGLDEARLAEATKRLQKHGIKVFAFIPGDQKKRGPVFEGLPTLESHRGLLPYVACVELLSLHGLDGVFVGEMGISKQQFSLTIDFLHDDEIRIPCSLYAQDELYDRTFTVRTDSPTRLLRLAESREYSSPGCSVTEVANTAQRSRGSITIDNILYSRYCGEIQIIKHPLPADRRVNVIGNIDARYIRLLECVKNGQKLRLVRSW